MERTKMLWRTEMKHLFSYAILIILSINPVKAQTVNDSLWITNGTVYAITPGSDGKTLYIGGLFSAIGPYTGHGVVLDTVSGTTDAVFPKVNGRVYSVIPDGSGGWFIGGEFTTVGTASRNNIAHIKPDKTVDDGWNPNANAKVRTMALSGPTLYVGGYFTTIGDSARNNITALNTTTGKATAWDPDANNHVDVIAVSRKAIYIGGEFSYVGDSTRVHLAAVDSATGAVQAWYPKANSNVYAIAPSGPNVYLGGAFSILDTITTDTVLTTSYLAAVDTANGKTVAWDPTPNGPVYALLLSNSGRTLYIGGAFTSIYDSSGFMVTRNNIAAIDTGAFGVTPWDPNADNSVYALALSGRVLYAGGFFTNIGDSSRSALAAIDTSTAQARKWNPRSNDYVYCLAAQDSTIYAGGSLTSTGDSVRNNIAALDLTTGKATAWNPNADSYVYQISVGGPTVYTGGYFTSIGDSARNRIAALDTSQGKATAWNPKANGVIQTLLPHNSKVYAGGFFTSIGDSARSYLAELDTLKGTATSWNPGPNNYVYSLAASGSMLYAGGNFTRLTRMSDSVHKYIAAFDLSKGTTLPWDTSGNGSVRALAIANGKLFAGGYFTRFGDTTRNFLASFDSSTGKTTSWNPAPNDDVNSLAVDGSAVYVGGLFTALGTTDRRYLGALDINTGIATSWNPNPDNYVYALLSYASDVYAGGEFSAIAGTTSSHASLARLTGSGASVTGVGGSSGPSVPGTFALNQNYPNPFNPSTVISFQIPSASRVTLKVYDLLGREISTLIDGVQTPGSHAVTFNAAKYASGVYFYRLQAGSFTAVKKLVLIK
jgi:hypothetical protein